MSNIRSLDLRFVDELVNFVRGPGFVLDFSDKTFAEFFAAELNIDIDHPTYLEIGTSKGKRLRCFLQKAENVIAIQALKALWAHRVAILATSEQQDPLHNAEGRFLTLLNQLGGRAASSHSQDVRETIVDVAKFKGLEDQLVALSQIGAQARGYAFEAFLKAFFDAFGLDAREPFRNRGEQIDGSFILSSETYLLEAKWQALPIGAADLHAFQGKLDQKAPWARGLFVSNSGFTEDGLHAFGKGKRVICVEGLDLYESLNRQIPFDQVLDRKVRRAAETGMPFVRVRELF